jgi:pimeloyl-ACP methyl ester carboxylesterase
MNVRKRLPGATEPMHKWPGAGGVMIAGDSWGNPEGPLVLLQHGGGQTRHAWKNSGEVLGAAGYHAITFDARGHGDSDWAKDGNYGQDIMVEDLLRVIDALGGRRPVLVGASMGGGTSLTAVGEDHVDATALVLVDIAPRLEVEGAQKILEFMGQKPDGFDTLEEAAEAISNYQPHRKRPRNLDGLAKNLRIDERGKYRWHWDPQFRAGIRDIDWRHKRMEACARNLTLPTLLVRGGLSDVLSEDGAREFLQLCPQAEYVNVTDAGHMVAGDRNDIFGNAMIEFLSRVVPVDGPPLKPAHKTSPHREGPGDVNDLP